MTRESYKKHKELIKAWGDGSEIEYNNDYTSGWSPCTDKPNWLENTEYRIKAKDETLYEWMVQYKYDEWTFVDTLYTEQNAKIEFETYKDYKKTGRSWKL